MFDGWLFGLLGLVLTVIPLWRLTEREGLNPLWSLVAVTGIGLIILLWVLAFRSDERRI